MDNDDVVTTNLLNNLTNNVHINAVTASVTTHEVFLDMDIEDPHKYRNLISLLINAQANDRIHLYINSNGGNLDTAIAIINAMLVCQAEITGFIMGACHSAASIITMYCHNVHVFETAYMMIHTASFGNFGNTTTVKTQTDFTVEQVEKLLDDAYKGFLDNKEMKEVKQGIELWYDSEEIRRRLKKRVTALEALEKKAAKNLK